jgi:DNA-binding transcriptional MerR regulator
VKSERPTRHYTLQELAMAAGMTVRNVRSYQTRGLIPPPRRQGRHSVYSSEHLRRLRQIHEARARGATLGLIGTHLSQGGSLNGGNLDRSWLPVLQGARADAPDATATRRRVSRISLDRMLSEADGDPSIDQNVERLVQAGVLHRSGQRLAADRALGAGMGTVVKHGLPVEHLLEVTAVAAELGRSLAAAMLQALAAAKDDGRVQAELVDLVAGVVGAVVSREFAEAERRSRP